MHLNFGYLHMYRPLPQYSDPNHPRSTPPPHNRCPIHPIQNNRHYKLVLQLVESNCITAPALTRPEIKLPASPISPSAVLLHTFCIKTSCSNHDLLYGFGFCFIISILTFLRLWERAAALIT